MALVDLLTKMEGREVDTSDTACNPPEVSGKPAPNMACTRATPATPETIAGGAGSLILGIGDTSTTYCWWLVHFRDRNPVEVACYPEATRTEILEKYPDAVAAKPFTPTIRQPSAPMTTEEEAAIRAWLALIKETDPATITEVMGRCQRDVDARDYFTRRGADSLQKIGISAAFYDDRRTCNQCSNLIARRCQAAKRGEIVASRNYEPIRELPRRCEGYAPGAADPDRRHGRERWRRYWMSIARPA